ncbi:MAG: hypothetical protein KBT03_09665 [Bacteroidales bacterium]|nr:hypothetical protein [Candidatus Scybalousia scybalohippi]
MAYEKKEGDITLFDNKKTKDTQPDFKGTVLIGGKELEVALWKRTSQAGKNFLSGKVSQPVSKKQDNCVKVEDDEIPF